MLFDKQRVIMFLLKAVSYTVNTAIVVGVVTVVGFFVYYLFLGGSAKIERKPRLGSAVEMWHLKVNPLIKFELERFA